MRQLGVGRKGLFGGASFCQQLEDATWLVHHVLHTEGSKLQVRDGSLLPGSQGLSELCEMTDVAFSQRKYQGQLMAGDDHRVLPGAMV